MQAPSMDRLLDIPLQYREVLERAEEERGTILSVRQRLEGGRSGAYLYIVDESTRLVIDAGTVNAADTTQLIMKLMVRRAKIDQSDEVSNLFRATNRAGNFRLHLVEVSGQPIVVNERAAIFYKVAGNSLQRTRTIASYAGTQQAQKALAQVSHDILNVWNDGATNRYTEPSKVLNQWLEFRIEPKTSHIPAFLTEACKLSDPSLPGISVYGNSYPNPYLYARSPELWGGVNVRAEIGQVHGDLHIGNVLAQFDFRGELREYYLIDFGYYRRERFLGFDNAYLELSYLLRLVADGTIRPIHWASLIAELSKDLFPDIRRLPEVIRASTDAALDVRRSYGSWIEGDESRLSRQDDLWGQYLLAAVAAGLNYTNKAKLDALSRWCTFTYAAAHLHLFFERFGVPLPQLAHALQIEQTASQVPTGEDWGLFLSQCGNFSPEYMYALIVDPIKMTNSNLAALGRVAWSVVLDLDENTRSGLFSIVEPELSMNRSTHLVTKSNQEDLTYSPKRATYWYAARGLAGREDLAPSDGSYRQWHRHYGQAIADFLRGIAESSLDLPLKCVVCAQDIKVVSNLCERLDETFTDRAEFLFLSDSGKAHAELASEYGGKCFQLTIQQLAEGISRHVIAKGELQQPIELPGQVDNTLRFVELDRRTVNWLEEELTLLHRTIGIGGTRQDATGASFFRGNTISWFELSLDLDVRRSQTEGLRNDILLELQSRHTVRFSLYHEPGAGGTTLVRRIAWDLHREFPTVIVNQYTEGVTIGRIVEIFQKTQRPVLVVVDRQSGLTADRLDLLYGEIGRRNLPAVLLSVFRQFGSGNPSLRRRYLNHVLDTEEADRFFRIYSREVPERQPQLANLAYDREYLSHRTPFYFGLTAFEDGFSMVSSYVDALLEGMSHVERDIMGFLAIAHIYTPLGLPAQFFRNIIGVASNVVVRVQQVLDPKRLSLLVYEAEREVWRVSHYVIAEELRNGILGGQLDEWRQQITTWALRYIDYCAKLRQSGDVQSSFVTDLMFHLFVNREQGAVLDQFSRLITDLPSQGGDLSDEATIVVLERLKSSFPEEPHFQAHYARRLSHLGRHERAVDEATESVKKENNDYKLQHILGNVLARYAHELIEEQIKGIRRQNDNKVSEVVLHKIDELSERAESAFVRSLQIDGDSQHSYVSHIRLLVDRIRLAFYMSGCNSYTEFWRSSSGADARAFLEKAEYLLERGLSRFRNFETDTYWINTENSIRSIYGQYQIVINNLRALDQTAQVRRQLVRAILYNRASHRDPIPSREVSWDWLRPEELQEIRTLMEQNFIDDPAEDTNIRYWLHAARRLPDTSPEHVLSHLQPWYARTESLEALYYLYVIHALMAIDEGVLTARQEAEKYIRVCRKRVEATQSIDPNFSYNWLGLGKGLARLVDHRRLKKLLVRDWFKDETGTPILARERGVILSISGPTKGEIQHLGSGLRLYFTPGLVRRTEADAGDHETQQFLRGRDEEAIVDFFIGFSYGGLRAFDVARI